MEVTRDKRVCCVVNINAPWEDFDFLLDNTSQGHVP
jgi:hypothetical protein